jgi:hypothetical protein
MNPAAVAGREISLKLANNYPVTWELGLWPGLVLLIVLALSFARTFGGLQFLLLLVGVGLTYLTSQSIRSHLQERRQDAEGWHLRIGMKQAFIGRDGVDEEEHELRDVLKDARVQRVGAPSNMRDLLQFRAENQSVGHTSNHRVVLEYLVLHVWEPAPAHEVFVRVDANGVPGPPTPGESETLYVINVPEQKEGAERYRLGPAMVRRS